ncbi:ArgE/DapE family deacylase [Limosilactobacillus antri]|uniref:Probable succinyl-diaminopimelate desuccinylase n=1 Tax=Limosilactobacillus antri DSM 16041 TaxID=525309 RepID=C8P498_9LACO|nr:ArgE/DapE family deacylase [Limosilactobacillus antri]EEW54666.1 peptidase, ArgE/DapE family [Limosilactobacillus antri DSM 16041]KRK60688.1 M20 M25 M40 family peptidase [Limosilactobacillus antri DSM 16041]
MEQVFTDQEKVQVLADLVAIQSVNDNEMKVAVYLHDLFAKYGITAKILPLSDNRADLVAEIGSGKPVLGVSGHMDVVTAGELSQWHSDPFTLTERDGHLYGRGATDMKSGLAALVIAMITIQQNHLLKRGTIRLMATAGEEIGEQGSRYLKDQGYMDDVDALLIAEPTGYRIATAHKGSMDIKLTSHGIAAHSSMPDEGYNAIDPLMKLLVQANQAFRGTDKTNAQLGRLTFNTTVFNGGDQVNSIPARATAKVNVRTIPEFNNDLVTDRLRDLTKTANQAGAKIDLDIYMSQPSIQTTGRSRFVQLAQKIGSQYAGQAVPTFALNPVTDASNLVVDKGPQFPLAVFGPGNDTPHQVNEYVDRQMYLNFIELYINLFTAYLN